MIETLSPLSRHPFFFPQPGKRRNNLVLVAVWALIAILTWQAGRNGGGVCFGGACVIPEFAQMDGAASAGPGQLDSPSGAKDRK